MPEFESGRTKRAQDFQRQEKQVSLKTEGKKPRGHMSFLTRGIQHVGKKETGIVRLILKVNHFKTTICSPLKSVNFITGSPEVTAKPANSPSPFNRVTNAQK